MENNFIWTDDKVMEFAIKWLKDRVSWAIMHDFIAAPMPIQVELLEFKKKYNVKPDWCIYEIHDNGSIRVVDPTYKINNNSEIFSVKRLTDEIIFRIGDYMHYDNQESYRIDGSNLLIDYFAIYKEDIFIHQHWVVNSGKRIINWVKIEK